MSFSGNPYLSASKALEGRYPSIPENFHLRVLSSDADLGQGNWELAITWKAEQSLETVAPADPSVPNKSRSLLPTLPEQNSVLNPLMTWWILLFGLSVFARYEPELWMEALDVNQSPLAVPLESVLQRALVAVPALLHEELLIKIA
jgi:hypothetical protein